MDPTTITADLGAFGSALATWAAGALPNLLAAVVLSIAGWWAAVWAQRALGRVLDRQTRIDVTVRVVVLSLVRYAILVVVLVAALGQLGVQTTSVFAALGAIGLAIGLALQGTLANVAAGFMLLWLRPFKVGDYIDAGGIAGTLHEVGIFACQIHTWDGIFQFVPNAELWNKRVINYSRLPTRLVDLKFGIAYDDSIARARDALMKIAASDERVHRYPEPQVFVDELGDSAVVLGLRVWANTPDYWAVRRALTEEAKLELERAGLTIPFPQRDVHVHRTPVDGARRASAANAVS
jgi:small conductance mechanosensitive channel